MLLTFVIQLLSCPRLQILENDPSVSLQQFLSTALGSERALFEEIPLMRALQKAGARIAAKHYVELRRLLHRWSRRQRQVASVATQWHWPLSTFGDASPPQDTSGAERSKDAVSRQLLWFEKSEDLYDAEAAGELRDCLDWIISEVVKIERREVRRISVLGWVQARVRLFLRRRRKKAAAEAARAALLAATQALQHLSESSNDSLPSAISTARKHLGVMPELDAMLAAKERDLSELQRNAELRRQAIIRRGALIFTAVAAAAMAIFTASMLTSTSPMMAISMLPSPELREPLSASPYPTATLKSRTLEWMPTAADAGASESMASVEQEAPPAAPGVEAEGDASEDTSVAEQEAPLAAADDAGLIASQPPPLLTSSPELDADALNANAVPSSLVEAENSEEGAAERSVRNRLQELKALREEGLLTEQNYLLREREIAQEI